MNNFYTDEINAQIILALLKAHGIRKVIASPGATNVVLVTSMQNDSFFEMYSAVDERSAAYMACGLAEESGEPVVISCTGATASRNYAPGMTEAYYRKLPILAITSAQFLARIDHLIPQVIDRSVIQNDVAKLSVTLPIVNDENDKWDCEMKANKAILELKRHGGGPVHINLPTRYSKKFDVKTLPEYRILDRITLTDDFPSLPKGRIGILVGSHKEFTESQTNSIDRFCEVNNGVVLCDHTSGYNGKYKVSLALISCQRGAHIPELKPDLTIHIGEVTGNYYYQKFIGATVWRISEDGEIKDTFGKLKTIFEMPEDKFFDHFTNNDQVNKNTYLEGCKAFLTGIRGKMPELPLSNPWIASKISNRLPENSVVHFGILNSLRGWNFFDLPSSVKSACNVGGFGIDGCLSSLAGAALCNPEKLYFMVIGDLAFFYDMNIIGNRHIGKNIRILLVNNGKGTEFRHSDHPAGHLGEVADEYVAAEGHFGKKSKTLVKNYAEDLGLEYLQASDKNTFMEVSERFLDPEIGDRSQILEVFTTSDDESLALETIMNIEENVKGKSVDLLRKVVGAKGIKKIKKVMRK